MIDEAFARSIQKRMEELAKANLPITKRSLDTDQAAKYFDRIGFKGKKELFQFRRESKTNIYSLDGYDNYLWIYGTIDRIYSSIFGVCISAWGSTSDSKKETDGGNRTIYTTAKTFPCDAAFQRMDEDDGC